MKLKFVLPLVVSFVLSAFLLKGLFMNPHNIPSALIGKTVPEYSLPRLDSIGVLTKKDMLGRVYLINVWASWCAVCAEEHSFWHRLRSAGKKFYLLGYDYKDRVSDAKRSLVANTNPYDAVIYDEEGKTAIDFGIYGTPETFVVDKKGFIREKIIGAVTKKIWHEKIEPLLRTLEVETP